MTWWRFEDEIDFCWHVARREHAFMLRCEGMLHREIGERLGVNHETARKMIIKFAWEINHSTKVTKARIWLARHRSAQRRRKESA